MAGVRLKSRWAKLCKVMRAMFRSLNFILSTDRNLLKNLKQSGNITKTIT